MHHNSFKSFQHIREHQIQVSHQDYQSKLSKGESLSSTSCKSSFHQSLSGILEDLELNLNINENCEQCNDFLSKYNLAMDLGVNKVKRDEVYSKNFVLNYGDVDQNEVVNNLKIQYPHADISVNCNEAETSISLESSKRIRIRSAEKLKYNGVVPSIRKFTYEERKASGYKIENISRGTILKSLKNFLTEPSNLKCVKLSMDLRKILLNVNVLVHSEFVMASIIFYFSSELGKQDSWTNFRIFSLDSKMEIYTRENDKDKANAFRCDFILLRKSYLFIFEYKYRHNRSSTQASLAMRCIKKKDYVKKVCYFLSSKDNYANMIEGVTHVISVGIGYSVIKDKEVHCGMKYKKEEISQYLAESKDLEIEKENGN
jgi:hypothetical protein